MGVIPYSNEGLFPVIQLSTCQRKRETSVCLVELVFFFFNLKSESSGVLLSQRARRKKRRPSCLSCFRDEVLPYFDVSS